MFRRHDRAESGVIAEVLMIAGAIAGAALIFLLYSGGGGNEAPPAVGLNDDGATQGGTKSFTVASALPSLDWGDLAILLDGTALTYSSALASDNTYCIVTSGSSCVLTGLWDGTADVAAGQSIRIHHADLSGKTFLVRQSEANAIVYAKVLGS